MTARKRRRNAERGGPGREEGRTIASSTKLCETERSCFPSSDSSNSSISSVSDASSPTSSAFAALASSSTICSKTSSPTSPSSASSIVPRVCMTASGDNALNGDVMNLNGERCTPLTMLSFSRMASGGKRGVKLDRGGEATGSTSSSLATCGWCGGEDDERYSGGAEVALREDLRVAVEALGAAALRVRGFGGGCTGEDD